MPSKRKIRVIAFRLKLKQQIKAKKRTLRHKDAEKRRSDSKMRKEVKNFLGFDKLLKKNNKLKK